MSPSRIGRPIFFLFASLLPAAAVLAPGCTGQEGKYCSQLCECEICDDLREEGCIIQMQALEDAADAYECDSEYDDFISCLVDDGDCDEDVNNYKVDDCVDEQTDLFECGLDASDVLQNTTNVGPETNVTNQSVVVNSSANVGGFGGSASSSVSSTVASTSGTGGNGGFGGM